MAAFIGGLGLLVTFLPLVARFDFSGIFFLQGFPDLSQVSSVRSESDWVSV